MNRSTQGLALAAACLLGGGLFYAGRETAAKPDAAPVPAAAQSSPAQDSAQDSAQQGADHDMVEIGADGQRNIGLQTARAARSPVVRRLHAQGELMVDPARLSELRPLGQGRVIEVRVKPGDPVTRGQALVVYEDEELTSTNAQLVQALEARTQAQAGRAAAAAALARGRALLGGMIAPAEVDRRRVALAEADATLKGLDSRIAELRRRQEEIGQSHEDPGEAVLRAPADGYVTAVGAAPGDVLDSTRVAVAVADLSDLWLRLAVYQTDMGRIASNGTVPFTVAALPGQHFEAPLDERSVSLDPTTGAMWVRCVVANPGLSFRPGMSAEGDLPTRDSATTLSVPAAAIQQVNGDPVVFVRQGPTRFRLQRVRTGIETPDAVEIADGLSPGDTVVTQGSFWLKSQFLQAQLGAGE